MAYFSESETCCSVDDYDEIVDMFIIAAPSLLIDSAGLVQRCAIVLEPSNGTDKI